MANPIVVNLNFRSTIANQDFKCLDCEAPLDTDGDQQVYFRMDQTVKPSIYKAYCRKCGLEWEKKDKAAGNVTI